MILETENKKVNLVLRTRKIVDVTKKLQGKNFEDVYFQMASEKNTGALSEIIYLLAENEDKTNSFKKIDEVYDFIDDYKLENQKTYGDMYEEIAEAINEEGFFNTKMTKAQIKEKISSPLSGLNMNDVIKNSTEKAVTKIATEQFQGYRA